MRNSKNCVLFLRGVVSLLLVSTLFGCASQTDRYSPSSESPPPLAERVAIPSTDSGDRLPWEVWALGRDLKGDPLADRMLLEGDEHIRRGDRAQALRVYRAIDPRRLRPPEREVLALRTASTQLGLDQAREALSTMSTFFRAEGRSEADVDPRVSLLFGYAYGRLKDLDQSLAWFSRANRIGRSAGLSESAALGVKLLVRSIEDSPLYTLSERWRDDAFVHRLIGEERRRRVQPGYFTTTGSGPFWSYDSDILPGGSGALLAADQRTSGHSVVGVILPLTGPFASLGRATKQGIELAVEGQALPNVSLEVRDDAGDSLQAVTAARELLANPQTSMVLGPLLSEPAIEVSELMRSQRRPILSFAKSGDIRSGEGVHRLGPTSESQVSSLLRVLETRLSITRFGIVYPEDAAGQEFARIFGSRIRDLGLQVVYEASYGREDFSALFAIAQIVREKNLEAVFFPDALRVASRFFSYLNVGGAPHVRPLGTASWDSLAELQQSRAVLDGAVFVSPFFQSSERVDVQRFIASYRSRFSEPPDFLAAQGFDAATVTLEALRRSRPGGNTFDEGLRSLGAYEGLTGSIIVRSDGVLEREFKVVEFRDERLIDLGQREVLTSEASATTDPSSAVAWQSDSVASEGQSVSGAW